MIQRPKQQLHSLILVSILSTILLLPSMPVYALSLSAQSAILIEQESGRILYEKNSHNQQLIASITKILTALVALEQNIPLEQPVDITLESTLVEGSSLYLQVGDSPTLETLLYGLLLHSGNDAATAIAIHCAGSVDQFVALMNQKAQELQLQNSSFANPHGLNAENHYSTAYDMALVAQAALENETLSTIVATSQITLEGRSFTNKNKLLTAYDGCIGMKTGYTELAGRTLISAAQRDDMTLICVTLDAPNDWIDHSNLFDYGFQNYTMTEITPESIEIPSIPVAESLLPFVSLTAETSFRYPTKAGEQLSYEYQLLTTSTTAPVIHGEQIDGEVTYWLNQDPVGTVSIIYQESMDNLKIESNTLKDKLKDKFTNWVEKIWLG